MRLNLFPRLLIHCCCTALWLAVLSLSQSAWASNPDRLIEDAVTLYTSAQATQRPDARRDVFGRASLLFEQAAEAYPRSAALFANAGTAALQAQNYGRATLNLRRALKIDPDHAQSLVNLRHVRELLPNWVPKPSATQGIDSFFSWHKVLSAQERLIVVALVALAAAVLGAFGFYFAIPVLKWSALTFGVVWLVLMTSVGHSKFSDIDHGVVMVDSIARASDSVNAPSRYTQPLPPGTEVKVIARQDDWVKVQLNDGRDAWLRATQIQTI